MSLLNDALRKRRTDQQPPRPLEAAALFKNSRGRRFPKRYLAAGICGVAVLLMAAGTWAWHHWDAGERGVPPGVAQAVPLPAETLAPTTAIPPAAAADPDPPAPTAAPLTPAAAVPAEPPPFPEPARVPATDPQHPRAPAQPAAAPAAIQSVPRPPMASMPAAQSPLPPRGITSEPLYRKAHLFQRQGRTGEALAMYREVLKLDPNHFDARLNLTSIYLQTEQFTQAYALAAGLHRQAPDHLQVMLNLAIAQIGCGRTAEGLTLLDNAALRPQAPLYTIFFHKGVALRQLGQTQAAITWYQKAEALNPGDGRLLFNLALAFDQLQTYEPAVAYYLKYLDAAKAEIDPAARGQIQTRIRALRAELTAMKAE